MLLQANALLIILSPDAPFCFVVSYDMQGGTGHRLDSQGGGDAEMTVCSHNRLPVCNRWILNTVVRQGYASSPARHSLRLEVHALPGGSSGSVEISYKLRPTGATDAALTASVQAAAAAAAIPPASFADWDYPAAAFDILEGVRRELTTGWDKKSETAWRDLPQGITVPFSGGVPAVKMRVKKEFSSKAKPFWVQFQDASGEKNPCNFQFVHRRFGQNHSKIFVCVGVITDTVMKAGDDLRQDQVILGMLELFNTIWQREGVVHVLAGSGATVPGVAQLCCVQGANLDLAF